MDSAMASQLEMRELSARSLTCGGTIRRQAQSIVIVMTANTTPPKKLQRQRGFIVAAREVL
jgi:hypothetical protein